MKPRKDYARIAIVIALLAFLATAARSIATAPETYPVADAAATSLYTLEASQGRLQVGSYSRFGWNHPGPLLYQLLAGPYALSGRREIALKWAALALNVISLGACLYLLSRRSPSTGVGAALAFAPLLWREQRLLFTPWNPFIPVLALPLCMIAAADIAAGGPRDPRVSLLAFVLSVSLCVQAHAGLVIPCAVCCLAAGFGIWRDRAEGASLASVRRRAAIEALVLAAAIWALPLAAEMRDSPGNIHRRLCPEDAMSEPITTHTVAIFNASDDTVAMLKEMLSLEGYVAVAGQVDRIKSGEEDFVAFLTTHKPAALAWDIAPPYDRNWNFYKLIRALGPLAKCAIVLTTTHLPHLNRLAGQDTGAIEIVGNRTTRVWRA